MTAADTVTTTRPPSTPTARRARPTGARPRTRAAAGVPLPRYEALAIGLGCGTVPARRS